MTLLEGIFYFFVALVVLLFMITIHELGHYTAGKILKFKINEFSIGMGPALFKRKNKKTGETFSIRLIPLGGFCAFEDEAGLEDNKEEGKEAAAPKEGGFVSQKPWKRIIVFMAGAAFNFISAIIIVIFAFSAFGTSMPAVGSIIEGSPAWEALQTQGEECLHEGDIILEINGGAIYLQTDISKYLAMSDGSNTKMLILRDGQKMLIENIKKDVYNVEGEEKSSYGIGITLDYKVVKFSFGESIGRSVPFCMSTATAILEAFGKLFTGMLGLNELGGPITTIDVTMQVARSGFGNILYLITMISINLAIFNMLPIPALDGSKIIFTTIEWIRGKPINRKVENYIHMIGLILLFGFVIMIELLKLF